MVIQLFKISYLFCYLYLQLAYDWYIIKERSNFDLITLEILYKKKRIHLGVQYKK